MLRRELGVRAAAREGERIARRRRAARFCASRARNRTAARTRSRTSTGSPRAAARCSARAVIRSAPRCLNVKKGCGARASRSSRVGHRRDALAHEGGDVRRHVPAQRLRRRRGLRHARVHVQRRQRGRDRRRRHDARRRAQRDDGVRDQRRRRSELESEHRGACVRARRRTCSPTRTSARNSRPTPVGRSRHPTRTGCRATPASCRTSRKPSRTIGRPVDARLGRDVLVVVYGAYLARPRRPPRRSQPLVQRAGLEVIATGRLTITIESSRVVGVEAQTCRVVERSPPAQPSTMAGVSSFGGSSTSGCRAARPPASSRSRCAGTRSIGAGSAWPSGCPRRPRSVFVR